MIYKLLSFFVLTLLIKHTSLKMLYFARCRGIDTAIYRRLDRLKTRRHRFSLAIIRVYKRNSTFVELPSLVEELSNIGLSETLNKYYNKPFEHEAKSIVAGPSFMQFLNKLFKTQIAAGDILQFESDNHNKFFMFSMTGTWDEIIKLQ
jgi:hypothetical protein